jgi:hypothetical protein
MTTNQGTGMMHDPSEGIDKQAVTTNTERSGAGSTMIYEQRVYRARPGKLPALLSRFENHVLRIWTRLGIEPVAFWTVVIGESNQMLIYMLRWKSLAEREKRWTAFLNDPEWLQVWNETDKDGTLALRTTNQILKLTSFSNTI